MKKWEKNRTKLERFLENFDSQINGKVSIRRGTQSLLVLAFHQERMHSGISVKCYLAEM